MTITARYPGICAACARSIRPGTPINWDKNTRKTTHVNCQANLEKSDPSNSVKQIQIQLCEGEGYGGRSFHEGEVVRAIKRTPDGGSRPIYLTRSVGKQEGDEETWLFVLKAWKRYFREEGLSFGVGDDRGNLFYASCRSATAEEAAPEVTKCAERERATARKKELAEIFEQIQTTGEYPSSGEQPEGERVDLIPQSLYGGGRWFVLSPEWIWAVQNNGSDGDDWSRNNVRTGGAGAIGARIPRTAEIAARLERTMLES